MNSTETATPRHRSRISGFSLVELLVVISIVAVLATLLIPVISSARARAQTIQCQSTLRQLGAAIHLYAVDHAGTLPRSWHSAGAHRTGNWAMEIAPYLHQAPIESPEVWRTVFNQYFRSPIDPNTEPQYYSYGLNVYFELDSLGDSYPGSPKTWRHLHSLPNPAQTILLAQIHPTPFADHFMCHQWSGQEAARRAVLDQAHRGGTHFLFADGHVQLLPVEATFDPQTGINQWHPEGG